MADTCSRWPNRVKFSRSARRAPVPYTRAWFLGVSNLRGGLYGVVDLGAFVVGAPGAPEAVREQSRLVALNAMLEVNCALLVDRLAGPAQRRMRSSLRCRGADGAPGYFGSGYTDAAGSLLAGDQPAVPVAAPRISEHQRISFPGRPNHHVRRRSIQEPVSRSSPPIAIVRRMTTCMPASADFGMDRTDAFLPDRRRPRWLRRQQAGGRGRLRIADRRIR